jgi:predicted nuclease of predicted toxin-antitoxin system
MSMGLYMDVHVPRAVTEGLRRRGHDVLTAQEDGRRTLSDPSLMNRAGELGRAFVTQDEDLLAEATRRQTEGIAFGGVAYAHQRNITTGQFIRDLELICVASDRAYWTNHVEFLPY